MENYEQCGQGRSYCSLCTLDTTRRLCFVTRLIINKIDKVQWVDFMYMLFLAVEQTYLHGWKAGDVKILYRRMSK
jgi:hypothetical protein